MKFFFSTVTAKYTSENCQLSVQCCALDCLFLILFNEMIPGLRADKMFTFWKVLTKFCYQYEVHVKD